MTRKLISGLIAMVFIVLLCAPHATAADKKSLVIATASTTGTYYVMGGGMATLAPKKIDIVDKATAQVTSGSVENCRLIGSNEVDFAIANANVVMEAFKGSKRFGKGVKNIRTCFWMHMTHQHLIVAKDSKYQSLKDLKGKRIAVGAPGQRPGFQRHGPVGGIRLELLTISTPSSSPAHQRSTLSRTAVSTPCSWRPAYPPAACPAWPWPVKSGSSVSRGNNQKGTGQVSGLCRQPHPRRRHTRALTRASSPWPRVT